MKQDTALVCASCGGSIWHKEKNGVVRFPNNFRIDPTAGKVFGNCSCRGRSGKHQRTCNEPFTVQISTAIAAALDGLAGAEGAA